jgi:hypothetical protein
MYIERGRQRERERGWIEIEQGRREEEEAVTTTTTAMHENTKEGRRGFPFEKKKEGPTI